ncbi:MAG: peptidylprolyl isomerase [Planctomycetota bacterium]
MFTRNLLLTILCVCMLAQQCIPQPGSNEGINVLDHGIQPQVTFETTMGTFIIELFSYQAPQSANNFLQYVEEGYYENTIFHNVLKDLYVNCGTLSPDLVANEDKQLVNESNNGLTNIRGRVSLYGPPDIATSLPALLINIGSNNDIDFDLESGERAPFTVIGRVIQGMNVLDAINNLPIISKTTDDGTELNAIPEQDVIITSVHISTAADDLPGNQAPTANAGQNRFVAAGIVAALDGSNSFDPDTNDTLTYQWVQTEGTEMQLSGSDTSRATFTVPASDTPFVFELTVTDANGETDTATVTLTYTDTPFVRLKTTMGEILLEILSGQDQAPLTSINFMQYVEDGFYNGVIFHRAMPDFVVQGGGFLPGLIRQDGLRDPVVNEFSPDRSNIENTVAMAKLGGDPNSATSQFFFNLADNSENLDNQNEGFTVFARIKEGADVAQAMAQVETGPQQDPDGNNFDDVPVEDIIITSATIEPGNSI